MKPRVLTLGIATVAGLGLLTTGPAARGVAIWNGPTITFTKENFADWNLAANQDRITDAVWLTRQETQGLFNAATESGYNAPGRMSPADTEWAFGTLDQWDQLDYQPWVTWNGENPPSSVGQDAVVHLISDDIYIGIKFLSWSIGLAGGGGGFSYERTTVPEPETIGLVMGAFALAIGAGRRLRLRSRARVVS